MGGGGGSPQTTTTTSGIDDEFKPYLERVLSDVTDRYEDQVAKGPDAIVAAMTPEQEAALKAKADQSRDMLDYDATEDINRNLRNLQGELAGQAGPMIGGARFERATAAALADRSLDLSDQERRVRAAGATGLGEVGSTKQQVHLEDF